MQDQENTVMTLTSFDPSLADAPVGDALARCAVCHRPFDFSAGETAVIVRHIAYGYDFVHDGACLAAAGEWIFVEPGYDRPAFGRDPERLRLVRVAAADGWSAVIPGTPQQVLAGEPVSFEPLRYWALVEHADGARRFEGIVRDPEWEDEPGGAEFPEARSGLRASLGYVSEADRRSRIRRARWAALIAAADASSHASIIIRPSSIVHL
jgi:hypothetical protein